MKISKKIIILLLAIVIISIIGLVFYLKFNYINRANNGLKYKKYYSESGTDGFIELKEDYILFGEMDFTEIFKTMATLKVVKENASKFNSLVKEEKDELINLEVDKMIKANILQRNKEYKYTFNKEDNSIYINVDGYNFSLYFYDEPLKLKFLKKPKLEMYDKFFY